MSNQDNRLSIADIESLKKLTEKDSRFGKVHADLNWSGKLTELEEATKKYNEAARNLRLAEEIMFEVAKRFYPERAIREAKFT